MPSQLWFKHQFSVPDPFHFGFDVSDMGGAFLGDGGGSSSCHLETNNCSVQAHRRIPQRDTMKVGMALALLGDFKYILIQGYSRPSCLMMPKVD